jgi:hypothetical protein
MKEVLVMRETTEMMEVQEKGTNPDSVPFIVHESALARMERQLKRVWIALLVSIGVLLATNAIWIWYISQYDFVSYTVSSGGGGHASYIGNDGNIYNGESDSEEADEEKPQKSEGDSNP